MTKHAVHYIDGTWVDEGEPIEVVSPADGSVVGTVPEADAAVVDRAVQAAKRAFPVWSTTPMARRIEVVQALRNGVAERQEEIAQTVSREMGSPISFARVAQIVVPLADLDALIAAAEAHEEVRVVSRSLVVAEPVGVVGAITPWNYPLHQIMLKIGAALLAGCTVVLKPSEEVPFAADIVAQIIDGLGLPAGVFNQVHGRGVPTGDELIKHPDLDMVSFTGSRAVGELVGAAAGGSLKRVALELGGKSAAIVLDDVDLETAVTEVVSQCFANAGQTCAAMTRALVPAPLLAEFQRRAVEIAAGWEPGLPSNESTRMGPVVSMKQQASVRRRIDEAVEQGATLLYGGADLPDGPLRGGAFVRPTIFGDVTPEMSIYREEVFGPVLAITPYQSVDEAVALANDSEYGLSGGVWTTDTRRGVDVARRIRTGVVNINGARLDVAAPFGGYKKSGIGRECGVEGFEEFLELKSITGVDAAPDVTLG
jgi:NAD-dependent aldehyde dehydrogenases